MDEVRNRIDELEEERNDQHRYLQIESEINRLKAIKLSGKINNLTGKISEFNEEQKTKEIKSQEVSNKLGEVTTQIENISQEKKLFLFRPILQAVKEQKMRKDYQQ